MDVIKGRFVAKSKDSCPFCGGLRMELENESIILDPLCDSLRVIGQSRTLSCYTCCGAWKEHSLDHMDETLIEVIDWECNEELDGDE